MNINTNFTIYTVNSILTSLRWIYIQYKNMLQDLLLKRVIGLTNEDPVSEEFR